MRRQETRPRVSGPFVRLGKQFQALCLILVAMVASAESPCSPEALESAQRSYDLGAATSTFEACGLEAPVATDAGHRELLARAALLVAEMTRMVFESTPEAKRPERRALGVVIDEAADEGLESLKDLPETSERRRLEADLLATKIRSDFRGKKYGKKMKKAGARALELDPSNVLALVSRAKPFLFADSRHGGDLEEAIRILTQALTLEPGLESALLLRALAYEKLGRNEASRKDLETVLRANPQCRPALERLKE